MTNAPNQSIPEKGRLRRALGTLRAWLRALEYMDHTGFDYALDRIELLEHELACVKEELRQSRPLAPKEHCDSDPIGVQS